MAVFKVSFLLMAMMAFTLTLANPTTAPDPDDDEVPADGTVDMGDLDQELPDTDDLVSDPEGEVEGIPVKGLSSDQVKTLLEMEENIVENDLDNAVGASSNSSRKKRATRYTFFISNAKGKLETVIVKQNIIFLRLAAGTYRDALQQFLVYRRAGAFRAVHRVRDRSGRYVGFLGLVGRTSPHRVFVRQAPIRGAASLSVMSSRGGNRWTIFKYYYLPC